MAWASAAVAVAAACGGAGDGRLLLADQGDIVSRDVRSGAQTLLITPVGGQGAVLRDPAPSPASKRIAYVRAAAASADGGELWLADLDGRDPHPSLQQADVRVSQPQWLDERTLLAIVRSPGGVAVERIVASTGERAAVVAGAVEFGLSRDRRSIVYVRPTGVGALGLFVAAADGRSERPVVGADQGFAAMASPRFAPDGRTIVFAAPAPGMPAGTPADVWTVDAGGSAPRRLVTLQEAQPALAFGRDGRRLFVLSASGLSEVDVRDGTVRRRGEGAGGSALSFVP